MLFRLYIFTHILPHVLAFKMIRDAWADRSAGCSIGKLNDYRLVSFGKESDNSGWFIPIDSSGTRGDIDENMFQLRYFSIDGYALRHGIPCSIYNNTVLLYALSYGPTSNIYLEVLLEHDDGFYHPGAIVVDVGNNLTADATITKTDLWINSGWFVTVWSQKSSIDDPYTLYAKPYFLNQNLTIRSFSDIKRMDDNIDRVDQRDSKIVKSAISERIFVVWSEYDAIYGKIYSNVLEMFSENEKLKFQIVNVSDNKLKSLSATGIQIYQVLPLSVGGFAVLFDVMSVKDNEFYFVILSENGQNVFGDILSINSIFALYDPNYIGYAQMIEMPLTLDDRSCTFIGFVYSKFDENPSNSFIEYTAHYVIWIFFHLDYSNNFFFYVSPYHDRHYAMTRFHDSGYCNVLMGTCYHSEYSPRKLCVDLNANGGGYLLSGFTRGKPDDILHGSAGSITDYYNCYSSLDLIKYLCISDESDEVDDTYIMHGCFNKYPYYIGDDLKQLKRIYFDYKLDQYIINITNDSFACNVNDMDDYTDITQCDGNWYKKMVVTNLTIFGDPCDDFQIPTTTTSATTSATIDPQNIPDATTKSVDTTSMSSNTNASAEEEIKGSTIAIIVVVAVVAVVTGIAVYIFMVKKRSLIDKKHKQSNEDNAVSEEQINLKETEDSQKVQPVNEGNE